ncbi:hypothetical protein NP233_g5054 [Leucocoprinus birnbaumii]|uniref:Mitochondrial carrier n=1 Tax=Leucocoprinus birnbaumii TaxID=56174 RepID=A0AAD5VVW0_9AGAR|nr:hypothetical protein NP233_g5054 [Leucocoprinus birnbaumii]
MCKLNGRNNAEAHHKTISIRRERAKWGDAGKAGCGREERCSAGAERSVIGGLAAGPKSSDSDGEIEIGRIWTLGDPFSGQFTISLSLPTFPLSTSVFSTVFSLSSPSSSSVFSSSWVSKENLARRALTGPTLLLVTTLGQPLEVLKTQMAANRSQTMVQACKTVWSRGGVAGFFQGLIPWAWIEASTKGAVLVFTASEVETASLAAGINPGFAGLLGGMTGGVAQAYATMGFTTCMKTVEITRQKTAATGAKPPSTFAVFMDIYRKEGIRGVNKGVNAVAVRQCTNWGSRMGFARLAESMIRKARGKGENDSLSAIEKIGASTVGGALATWNQPIEVIRVEMQSMAKNPNRPAKMTIMSTLKYIYSENGMKGLYRGVTPRIGLGVWQTICMVSLADYVKAWVKKQ